MLSSFKDKPDAQKVIGNNPARRRKNITQRIVYPMKVGFSCKKLWKISAEYFEAANLYNGAQSSCNDEEQNLFLA